VCLYKGCIPSKAVLHAAKLINEAREAKELGLEFMPPKIDLDRLRAWKDGVVQKLTGGVGELARLRKIRYVRGRASFFDEKTLLVQEEGKNQDKLAFDYAVIATGSRPSLPAAPATDR